MDKEGEIKSGVLCEQYPQVEDFVKYLTYYKCILREKLTEKSKFYEDACNLFLGMATIAWCNVFGFPDGDLYWSKLIKNMPEKIEQDFKACIYKSTDLDKKKYQQYQKDIRALRDKYFTHRDLNWQKHIPLCVIEFDNALIIAKQYEEWLCGLLEKENSVCLGPRFNEIIKDAEAEVTKLSAK